MLHLSNSDYSEEKFLVVIAYKHRGSELRSLLKIFKQQFDDLKTLSSYEATLRRLLFFGSNRMDQSWRGEGFHQLALLYEAIGRFDEAEKYYVYSMEVFADHELLGLARVMRDYGLFMARYTDPKAGLLQIEQALALHEKDHNNAKGFRQRRITESYVWRARLLIDCEDTRALNSLIEFALTDCHDCCLRDQQHAIEFVAPYASGMERQLLDTRLIEVNARRRNVTGAILSMARLVIDTELIIARKIVRTLTRKE